ncbi:rRNA maturation RNase YbeY [Persephonella sp.]
MNRRKKINKIFISKDLTDRVITKKFINEAVDQILKELKIKNSEISILLTDNETIHKLNKRWRKKDKPTDVLSFPLNEEVEGYRYKLLGDVVISLPYAKKQAEENNQSYQDEVLKLLIHGILHLLGYDHERSEADAKRMFKKEEEIFKKLISYFSKTTQT